MMDTTIMRILANPPNYPTLPEAIDMLEETQSVAITHDLIVYPQKNALALVCRGTEVGRLVSNRYEHEIPDSPLAKRVQFKLDKEGVLC